MSTEWVARFDAGSVAIACLATVALLGFYLPGSALLFCGLTRIERPARLGRDWLRLAGVLGLAWFLWGYSLAFAPSWGTVPDSSGASAAPMHADIREALAFAESQEDRSHLIGRGGIIGGGNHVLLHGLTPEGDGEQVHFPVRRSYPRTPHLLFMIYQLAVCLSVTAPLVLLLLTYTELRGASLIAILWSAVVYAPVAHGVWGEGWLASLGAVDHGGSLLQLAVAASGLALTNFGGQSSHSPAPSTIAEMSLNSASQTPGIWTSVDPAAIGAWLSMLGMPFLFSISALGGNGGLGLAWCNALIASLTGMVCWAATSAFLHRPVSDDDWPLGLLAGSMIILAGAGAFSPETAFICGVLAGAFGSFFFGGTRETAAQSRRRYFAVQCACSFAGLLLCGVFSISTLGGRFSSGLVAQGLIERGDPSLLKHQAVAAVATLFWSLAASALLSASLKVLPKPRNESLAHG